MGETWSISDGTNTVNFTPGAELSRTLDKGEGLKILPRGNQAVPKYKDFKKSRDIFTIVSTFKDRAADVTKLYNMAKNTPVASSFTFSRAGTNFTVVIKKVMEKQSSGEGTLSTIICEMEVVTT